MTPGHNPYIFGDEETDRYRLVTQARLSASRMKANARAYVGDKVESILDLGCGEGQLGFALREVYPEARLVGIDRDARAIEQAQRQAAQLALSNTAFFTGDVEQEIPAGPFDLVFAELIFLHLRQTGRVLELIYDQLAPGGQLWVKDLNPRLRERVNHPAYQRLCDMLFAALEAIGSHPLVIDELPPLLASAGYEDVHLELEEYTLGGSTPEGQGMLAITLGAFYNARQLMSKVNGVSVSEVERLYVEVANYAIGRQDAVGSHIGPNLLARKPMAQPNRESA